MRTIRTNNKMITVRIRINHSKVKLKKKTNNELLFMVNWHLFHLFDYIQTLKLQSITQIYFKNSDSSLGSSS